MDIKKLKLGIEQSQKVCNEMDDCTNKFILQDSINEMKQALNIVDARLPSCEVKIQILEVANKLGKDEITYNEARKLLLDLFIVSESTLATQGLTIEYEDYGIWKLRQHGEYLMEDERINCNERAIEILDKHSR